MEPLHLVSEGGRFYEVMCLTKQVFTAYRVCPGRFFAENALFLFIASFLHILKVAPPLDEQGNPIQLQAKMTNGGLSYVLLADNLFLF